MSADHDTANLNEERDLLKKQLLPLLEEWLDELGDYTVNNETQSYKQEFASIASGEVSIEEYSLPTVQTGEFGLIFPEYFVVGGDADVSYAVAIEPHTKYIHIQDEVVTDVLQEWAEEWADRTHIKEISLGRADVSKVSVGGTNPNEGSHVFADRI